MAIIGCLAAVLLFWGLGERYLWQDEAATAVLSDRMLRFGRPMAYDGVNLITIDSFQGEEIKSIDQRTHGAEESVGYYVKRRDFKPDTTWKWQPWGQFVVAAAGLKLLGHTTVGARLPFALAALATVWLLYHLVRRECRSPSMAAMAALLLVCNAYWILHSRQCRYYSLSGLSSVLTLLAYVHWQRGGRWGAAAFVTAAWCWFQVDYGTFWPVMGVLFLDALVAQQRQFWQPLAVGGALAAAVAPFLYYYELWGRLSLGQGTWGMRFSENLFNLNQYIVPLLVVVAAAALLKSRWKNLPEMERRLVLVGCAIIVALLLWVPTATPATFLRYFIPAVPVGSLLTAWVLVRASERWKPQLAWLGAAVLVITPLVSLPVQAVAKPPEWCKTGRLIRPELETLFTQVFGHRPDPNRLTVEWLKQNAGPTDEILVNYEDVPLMFYLTNPIRGGMGAFRVEDDSKTPPRFLVLRRSVNFVHWPAFEREMNRYTWEPMKSGAPDVVWGNNPDPIGQVEDPEKAPAVMTGRRIDSPTH